MNSTEVDQRTLNLLSKYVNKSTKQTEGKKNLETQGTTYMGYLVPKGAIAVKLDKFNVSRGSYL